MVPALKYLDDSFDPQNLDDRLTVIKWLRDVAADPFNAKVDPFEVTALKHLTPWCSAFANACVREATPPIPGVDSPLALSWRSWGVQTFQPQFGDVVIFSRGARNSGLGHVGFYIEYEHPNRIRVLGGNQSMKVMVKSFASYKGPIPNAQGSDIPNSEIKVEQYQHYPIARIPSDDGRRPPGGSNWI